MMKNADCDLICLKLKIKYKKGRKSYYKTPILFYMNNF